MDKKEWLKNYRTNKSAIWIKVELTDGTLKFCPNYEGWTELKEECEGRGVFVKDLRLQFRSHEVKVDVDDSEAIYLVRSILSMVGGGDKHYYVVGVLKDGDVHKKKYIIPELVLDSEYTESIDKCFEEALIYDPRKKTEIREE